MPGSFAREPLEIIEIIQPLCSQVFGVFSTEDVPDPEAEPAPSEINVDGASSNTVIDVDGTDYRVVEFTSSGQIEVVGGMLRGVEYLIVGGGGSGGSTNDRGAGGGGAGGYRSSVAGEMSGGGATSEDALNLSAGFYDATVGSGGSGVSGSSVYGNQGQNSSLKGPLVDIVSTGGGAGGRPDSGGIGSSVLDGGSGGGRGHNSEDPVGSGTSGQGFGGGPTNFDSGGTFRGTSGGGAGGVGGSATSSTIGSGGIGVTSYINGVETVRAGGGGGVGTSPNLGSADSIGGGGGGGSTGASGAENTGGGGGAAFAGTSGSGGSGIVIVRWPVDQDALVPTVQVTVGCQATGDKCWNTDATCKFRAALDLSEALPLYFVRDEAHEWVEVSGAFQPALAIGALVSTSVAPTVLNVAGGSRNRGPLGYRAVLNVRIKDFPWNDVGTDPYLDSRDYDPQERGSFWSKWLKRNPFHVGYQINHYSGVRGHTLAQMTRRQYEIEKIDAGRDGVTIRAKDLLNRVNEVTAPFLSPGVLSTDIDDVVTSITVAGAVLADYQTAPGIVRIGDELIAYTGLAVSGDDLSFTGLTRGHLGTEASDHRQDARVQRVLFWVEEPFQNIVYELLTEWGNIDPALIDKDVWDQEQEQWRSVFKFTGYISQPVQIVDLLGELALQSLTNIWWDEREQEIFLKPVRPDLAPQRISDNGDILAGSFAIKEMPEERASQVFVYYNLRNPVLNPTDGTSYENAAVFIDVNKQVQYGGTPAIRELFCRFIGTAAIANTIAATYLNRFKDVRREISFDLNTERTFWTGDPVSISHFLDVDFTGLPQANNWLILSAQEISSGAVYRFTAEDNNMEGVLWLWVDEATTSPTWADATEEERATVGYWLNDDGTDAGGNPAPFRWL